MPRKTPIRETEELTVRGVEGFFEKVVSRSNARSESEVERLESAPIWPRPRRFFKIIQLGAVRIA